MRCSFALMICVCAFHGALLADTYAVLPLFNLSKDKNLDWIGESVSETAGEALGGAGLVALSRDNRIEVYRRLSIRPYILLTRASVIKIGESLDAEYVVFGQFQVTPANDLPSKSRGTLQLAARVLDLKRMKEGPEFREFGAIEDLASLQSHLAWQLLRFLIPDKTPTESDFRSQHRGVRVDALESYVRGLVAVNPDEKHRWYIQATRLDARYSQPWFHLGRLDWRKKEYAPAAEWFRKVPPGDAHYREATFFLGLCRYHTGDYAGAQSAFQTVAGMVPLSEVYNNLGAAESRRDLPSALENFRKALEGDASDPAYRFNVGYSLWRHGNFSDAAEHFRAVLDRDPADEAASMLLDRCARQSGPRPSDTRTEGLERLKTNYEESQYWQLKAVLQPEKP